MLHGLAFCRETFARLVDTLVDRYCLQSVVETGTNDGTGTTSILASSALPVVSIECSAPHHSQAAKNLSAFPNVKLLHGYSLPKKDMEEFLKTDTFTGAGLGIALDTEPENTANFYLDELNQGALSENLLPASLEPWQLVFLDSAGGVGWMEFQAVYGSSVRPLLVLLDDVDHVKHYRSIRFLRESGLEIGMMNRWAWVWLD